MQLLLLNLSNNNNVEIIQGKIRADRAGGQRGLRGHLQSALDQRGEHLHRKAYSFASGLKAKGNAIGTAGLLSFKFSTGYAITTSSDTSIASSRTMRSFL